MVRFKGWTKNARKSSHCPKKHLESLSEKNGITIFRDHFKNYKTFLRLGYKIYRYLGVAQEFWAAR